MVRAVLFDFYGTLARAVTWGLPFEDVFARRGLELDRDMWAKAAESAIFDGQDHLDQSSSRDRYVAWELDRLRHRVAACGVAETDVEPLVAELYAESKTFTLEAYPEVPDVLTALRRQDVLVAVCSNWDWDLDRALDHTGLTELIDVVVTSARAGARKPHPRIYQHTLDLCRVPADEAVFVGDTWGPDVEGPRAAGLRPVHVCRNGAFDQDQEVPALPDGVRRFPDLGGVLEVVAS